MRRCLISANWRSLCRWLKLPSYSLTHADANLPLGNLQPFHQHSHKFPQFVLTCSCTRSTLSQMQPGMSTIILSPDDEGTCRDNQNTCKLPCAVLLLLNTALWQCTLLPVCAVCYRVHKITSTVPRRGQPIEQSYPQFGDRSHTIVLLNKTV